MARLPLLLLAIGAALLAACSQNQPPAQPLGIESHFPAADATDVPVDAAVLVTFDSEVDAAELHSSIVLKAGDTVVSGELAYDAASRTLMFTPDAALGHSTSYVAVVAEGIVSLAGGTLPEAYSWAFTTEAVDGSDEEPGQGGDEGAGEPVGEDELPTDDEIPGGTDNPYLPPREDTDVVTPEIAGVWPKPWTRAQVTTDVGVMFNKEFDDAVLEGGVRIEVYPIAFGLLKKWLGFRRHGVDGVLTAEGDVVTFDPDRNLKQNRWYWVFLTVDVEDEGGHVEAEADWLFRTLRK